MTWMEGRCLELTPRLPFGPLGDLLRRRSAAVAKEVIESVEELVDEVASLDAIADALAQAAHHRLL